MSPESPVLPAESAGASFEPTRWSVIARVQGGDTTARQAALEALCSAYWYPLYAYLRRQGRAVEDAEDLVQDFFARLLDGSLLADADPARGKFRTLLLTALRNLNTDAHRAAQCRKRGGAVVFSHIDSAMAEERWLADSSQAGSPEAAFDRAWALAVMTRAGERLRTEHTGEKGALFAELAPRLSGAAEGDGGLQAIGDRLGMSEGAVKMALSRLRRRYAEAIREEVAETVGSREEVQSEIRYLLAAFA